MRLVRWLAGLARRAAAAVHRLAGCPKPALWVKRHPFTTIIVAVGLIISSGGYLDHTARTRDRHEAFAREAAFEREQRARIAALEQEAKARCQSSADGRNALREVIAAATAPSVLDLTALPAFRRLDPAVQEWVREINALSSSADGPNVIRRAQLLALAPPIVCP